MRNCAKCNRYTSNNQKPARVFRTPVYAQTLAVELFDPLQKPSLENYSFFLTEDNSTKSVEVFDLQDATSTYCAKTLIGEIFLR